MSGGHRADGLGRIAGEGVCLHSDGMDAYLQVSTTVGTRAEAAQLADRAVTESFAATAQVSGPVMIVDGNPYRDTQREA